MSDPPGIILMYHYLRPRKQPCPAGIRPLWTDEFEAQLDWLGQRYDILDAERLAGMLRGEARPTRPWCVLTFDDGTQDHATVAAPLLAERGLCGFFFLLTGPWIDRRLPAAHRLHALLSRVEGESLWNTLQELVHAEAGAGEAPRLLGQRAEAHRIYHYEDDLTRQRAEICREFCAARAAGGSAAGGADRAAHRR